MSLGDKAIVNKYFTYYTKTDVEDAIKRLIHRLEDESEFFDGHPYIDLKVCLDMIEEKLR